VRVVRRRLVPLLGRGGRFTTRGDLGRIQGDHRGSRLLAAAKRRSATGDGHRQGGEQPVGDAVGLLRESGGVGSGFRRDRPRSARFLGFAPAVRLLAARRAIPMQSAIVMTGHPCMMARRMLPGAGSGNDREMP
jgi:hypothetical protein